MSMANGLQSKKDYQETLLSLLEPLRSRFSDGCARVRLYGAGATYPKDVVEMEAFARPLWGLVPYWMGGGCSGGFEDIYRKGLASGTDPDNPEYWGDPGDYDQRYVEMAPIAFALISVPRLLWEPLADDVKDRLSSWLYRINDHEISRCNWYYFRILVNLALRKLGRRFSKERLLDDAAFIESCYAGGGWYEDGVSRRTDYYSAFAMQFYGLLCSDLLDDVCPGFSQRMRDRALAFSRDFELWFDSEGRGLPYGRSLIYRMAQSSFWSAFALFHISPSSDSAVRGIIGRNVRYWLNQDIRDDAGLLSVGYCYPNLTMAERYNAPGSPYWCCKAFMVLALPDTDPFWLCDEASYPQDLAGIHIIRQARMLIQHRGWDVSAYVPGMAGMKSLGHFIEKYDKFVYSTAFPFSVSHSDDAFMDAAPDNMLSFEVAGNIYARRGSLEYEIKDDSIYSLWTPFPGIEVKTTIKLAANGHIREHVVDSSVDFIAYDAGYSISSDGCAVETGDGSVRISCGDLQSVAGCLSGDGVPVALKAAPNTNIAVRNSIIACIKFEMKAGHHVFRDYFHTERTDGLSSGKIRS